MSLSVQKLGLKFAPLAMGAVIATGANAQGVSPYSPSLIGGYASTSDDRHVASLPSAINIRHLAAVNTSHCDNLGTSIGPFRIAWRDTVNDCVSQARWDTASRVTLSLLDNKTSPTDWVKAGLRPELVSKAGECRGKATGNNSEKIRYIDLCLP